MPEDGGLNLLAVSRAACLATRRMRSVSKVLVFALYVASEVETRACPSGVFMPETYQIQGLRKVVELSCQFQDGDCSLSDFCDADR